MREELAKAVADVLRPIPDRLSIELSEEEQSELFEAANLFTMARSTVTRDYQGNVLDAHAPEMPTRFAKQLGMVMRGAIAIGMKRKDAHALAMRCAQDSTPPLRLTILKELAAKPGNATELSQRLGKPYMTVRREADALHMLGLVRGLGTKPITFSVAQEWRSPLSLFTRKVTRRGVKGKSKGVGVAAEFSGK
jgi:hypothetical protein